MGKCDWVDMLGTAQKGIVDGGRPSNFHKGILLEPQVLVIFLYFLLKALRIVSFEL